MNLPNYGKPRVAKICLIALLCCFFLQQIACLPPPLDIDCYACFDGGCGKDTGFVCREGFCLRESDPDPTRCKKKEEPEKESEKTEVPEEISSPEENLIKPEEMISEEDSGNKEEPTPELLAEKEVEQDPNKVVISSLEGTGSEIEINYGGVSEPSNPVKAKKRYTDTWILTGENLNLVDSIELVREDTGVKVLDFNIQQKDSKTMTIKFPSKYILAGYFFWSLTLQMWKLPAHKLLWFKEKDLIKPHWIS